jgi:putative endopeptidase
MSRVLALALVTVAFAACATEPAPLPPAPVPVAAVASPEALPAPKAQVGTYGLDTAGMDSTVRPGDDFYQFANGTWAKNTPIPADKSNYGSFSALQDTSQQRVRDILDAAKEDPNSRIGAAYSSFLDEAAVESR